MSGCKACGDCCEDVVFPIHLANIEWAQVRGFELTMEDGEPHVRFRSVCPHFDAETRRCTIHATKPLTCKVYLCDEAKR